MQRIRAAAAGHEPATAHAAVLALRADVASLVARKQLAAADASVLTMEASQVDGRVSIEVKPVTAPAPTHPIPATPAPVTVVQGNSDGKGNGNGGDAKGPKPGHGDAKGPGHGHGGGNGGD